MFLTKALILDFVRGFLSSGTRNCPCWTKLVETTSPVSLSCWAVSVCCLQHSVDFQHDYHCILVDLFHFEAQCICQLHQKIVSNFRWYSHRISVVLSLLQKSFIHCPVTVYVMRALVSGPLAFLSCTESLTLCRYVFVSFPTINLVHEISLVLTINSNNGGWTMQGKYGLSHLILPIVLFIFRLRISGNSGLGATSTPVRPKSEYYNITSSMPYDC